MNDFLEFSQEKDLQYQYGLESSYDEPSFHIKQNALLSNLNKIYSLRIKCKKTKAIDFISSNFNKISQSSDMSFITSMILPDDDPYTIIIEYSGIDKLKGYENIKTLLNPNKFVVIPEYPSIFVKEVCNVSRFSFLQPKDFVMIQVSPYLGDVAQIFQCFPKVGRFMVRLIPRIDYEKTDQFVRIASLRPKKALLNENILKEKEYSYTYENNPEARDYVMLKWKNMYFHKGFQYKRFPISELIVYNDLTPTLKTILNHKSIQNSIIIDENDDFVEDLIQNIENSKILNKEELDLFLNTEFPEKIENGIPPIVEKKNFEMQTDEKSAEKKRKLQMGIVDDESIQVQEHGVKSIFPIINSMQSIQLSEDFAQKIQNDENKQHVLHGTSIAIQCDSSEEFDIRAGETIFSKKFRESFFVYQVDYSVPTGKIYVIALSSGQNGEFREAYKKNNFEKQPFLNVKDSKGNLLIRGDSVVVQNETITGKGIVIGGIPDKIVVEVKNKKKNTDILVFKQNEVTKLTGSTNADPSDDIVGKKVVMITGSKSKKDQIIKQVKSANTKGQLRLDDDEVVSMSQFQRTWKFLPQQAFTTKYKK